MSGEGKTPCPGAATPQCQFFVQRKKRLCRMTVKPGRQYCGEHEPQPKSEISQTDQRIPCPNDPKHTVYASKLIKHLAICNARRTEQPPYIVENINAPETVETCPRLPLNSYPKDVLANVIDKVNYLYAKHVEGQITAEPPSPIHRAVLPEFSEADRAESSLRHLRQVSALLWCAERAQLCAKRTCYVELGAGKGQLSYYAAHAWCGGTGSRVLAVDRAPLRHKRDNKLRSAPPTHNNTNTIQPEKDNTSESNMDDVENIENDNVENRSDIDTKLSNTDNANDLDESKVHNDTRISNVDKIRDNKQTEDNRVVQSAEMHNGNKMEQDKIHPEDRVLQRAANGNKMEQDKTYSKDKMVQNANGDKTEDKEQIEGRRIVHSMVTNKVLIEDTKDSIVQSKDEIEDTDDSNIVQCDTNKVNTELGNVSESREDRVQEGEDKVGVEREGEGEGVAVRLRADLAHLALEAVPVVAECATVVGLAKHLCGVATDYALRCIAAPGVAHKTRGLVLATCCHHRVERASYVANQQLQELGITAEDFNVMLGLVSWATCGDGRSRERRQLGQERGDRKQETANEFHKSGLTQEEREETGRRAKALLDWGRVLWLRARGHDARLAYYVPWHVSPENVALVAVTL